MCNRKLSKLEAMLGALTVYGYLLRREEIARIHNTAGNVQHFS
jgi:hypothetical protein